MIFQIGDKVRLVRGTTYTGGFGEISRNVDSDRTIGELVSVNDTGNWQIVWTGYEGRGQHNRYETRWLELVEAKVPFVNPTKAFVLSQKSVP